MGFFGTLQLILIVLKFVNLIDWSWWGVFAPLWIYIALVIIIALKKWMDDLCREWKYW